MHFGKFGNLTRNMLQNGDAAIAAFRQSPAEHDELLHRYERAGQSPTERLLAVEQGIQEEKSYPKYWNDEFPRRDLGASSSWIDDIEYLPDLGIAVMHTNGKQYYYPMSSDEAGRWVTSDSLGQYYNNNIKLK